MSQAEIAGGQVTLSYELPMKGHRLHDFELKSTPGRHIQLSDYRGWRNLVLVFTDDQQTTAELLSEISRDHEQFKSEEAQVIAVAQCSIEGCARITEQLKLPFPVLSDREGRIHREVGASDQEGHAAAAVYITDRYGEVFGLYRTRDGQTLPRTAEILNWLEFINSQCPECEAPEWPL